jgi:hypothetical protein
MKTSAAMLLPLLVTLAGACVVTSSPPPTDGPPQPPPPPPPATAAPPPVTPSPSTPPPVATPTTPPTTPTVSPTTPPPTAPPPASLIGRWISPSCGGRTYARKIEFTTAGKFDAQDLVSPCPPKVACIWSGIVDTNGTYTVASGMIRLAPAQPGNPKAQPLPATLAIDPTTGAPLETAGGGKCVYSKDTSKP